MSALCKKGLAGLAAAMTAIALALFGAGLVAPQQALALSDQDVPAAASAVQGIGDEGIAGIASSEELAKTADGSVDYSAVAGVTVTGDSSCLIITMNNVNYTGSAVLANLNYPNVAQINVVLTGSNYVAPGMVFDAPNVSIKGPGSLKTSAIESAGNMTVSGSAQVTCSGNSYAFITLLANGNLVIDKATVSSASKLSTTPSSEGTYVAAAIWSGGSFTAKNGAKVTATSSGKDSFGIFSSGKFTVSSSTVTAKDTGSGAVSLVSCGYFSGSSSKITASATGSSSVAALVADSAKFSKCTSSFTGKDALFVSGSLTVSGKSLYAKATGSKGDSIYVKKNLIGSSAKITGKGYYRGIIAHGYMKLTSCTTYGSATKNVGVGSHGKMTIYKGSLTAKSSYSGKKKGALWCDNKISLNKVKLSVTDKKGVGIAGLKGGTIKSCTGKVTSKKGYGVIGNSKVKISGGKLKINGKYLKGSARRF